MNEPSRRTAVGLLCATMLGAGGTAGAQAVPSNGVRLSMVLEQLVLEPPRAEELVGNSGGRGRAQAAAHAVPDGRGGVRVELPPPVEPLVGTLRRSLPRVWRLEVAPEARTPRVTLRLESPGGARDRLACHDDPGVTVVAYLRPFEEAGSVGPDGTVRIEGGAILEIPTTELTVACRLEGRIVAILEAW